MILSQLIERIPEHHRDEMVNVADLLFTQTFGMATRVAQAKLEEVVNKLMPVLYKQRTEKIEKDFDEALKDGKTTFGDYAEAYPLINYDDLKELASIIDLALPELQFHMDDPVADSEFREKQFALKALYLDVLSANIENQTRDVVTMLYQQKYATNLIVPNQPTKGSIILAP